jgi:predicted RNA binding protein YcfA (HicA-like mRNA interferase family)
LNIVKRRLIPERHFRSRLSNWPSAKARRVLAALLRLVWQIKRQSGSHRTLSRSDWPDVVFSFHDDEEIGPRMLARVAKRTGLSPVASVNSMGEIATRAIAPTTFSMTVLALFGTCAVLLAAVGIYGVLGYAVEQRTYEIGVRLALGASWHQVRNMVLLNGLKLASYGVVLGVAAAAALAGTLSALLFGVPPHDIVTFTTGPLLLYGVALAAVWFPARRASRIDPAEVLRRG